MRISALWSLGVASPVNCRNASSAGRERAALYHFPAHVEFAEAGSLWFAGQAPRPVAVQFVQLVAIGNDRLHLFRGWRHLFRGWPDGEGGHVRHPSQ